jgi:hypothetical protein
VPICKRDDTAKRAWAWADGKLPWPAPSMLRNCLVVQCLVAGLMVLVFVMSVASLAIADVDTAGSLRKVPSTFKSRPGEVEPLFEKASGDYECRTIYKYSDVQSAADSWVIGNCKAPWQIQVVSYSGPNGEGYHSYGGFVTGVFSGCGWIEARFEPEKLNSNSNSACSQGSTGDFEVPQSSFMRNHNSAVGDGWPVVNKGACPEYANYRPWSVNNVEQELVRTAPAYAGSSPGSNYPALKWRYITKYESTDSTGQYVMVRDDRYKAGEGNWVFVPRSCLPAALPEDETERIPPPPTVATGGTSSVETQAATLHGTVNPNGVDAKYHFEYGTTTSYGASTPEGDAGSGTGSVEVGSTITGLLSYTTYYYRIVATSATGTSYGGPVSFTTQAVSPTVTTSAASGVLEEQAVLNGTVNPNGLDAKYHFEYGETTAYGLSTSQGDAGSGRSPVPESATITGLVQNTTYHYRIVASNTVGTGYGSDKTFKTSFIRTTPVAIREASTGYQWVYYVGREHAVWEWTWNGSSWFNSRPGGFVAANTNLTAVRDSPSGNQWAYYIGGGDTSIWESNWNGSSWAQSRLGGETSPNTSPVVLREPGPGHQWLYYVGKDHAVWEWTWNGASWSNNSVGGFVAPSTTPSVARDEASGHQWVFYVGGGDTSIWQAEWNGSSWVQTHIGGEVAPNTNPVVLREAGTGYRWVYYVNKSDKSIWEWTWNGSSWSQNPVGGLVAPNTTPSVAREAGTGYQWVYYIGGGDGAIWEWTWNGSTWVSSRPGGLAASETSPAVIQPSAGFQWVYYQGSEDPITQLFWNGGTWNNLGL